MNSFANTNSFATRPIRPDIAEGNAFAQREYDAEQEAFASDPDFIAAQEELAREDILDHARTGRKFADDEVTETLGNMAADFTRAYTGTFDFVIDMKSNLKRYGQLTLGQARGILNCMVADEKRKFRASAPKDSGEQASVDYKPIVEMLQKVTRPAGAHKALKNPRIKLQTEGGRIVILKLAGQMSKAPGSVNIVGESIGTYPDAHSDWFGRIELSGQLTASRLMADDGDIIVLLNAFVADPAGFASIQGQKHGWCCFCSTEIVTAESLTVGYGPVCAERYGLPWGEVDTKQFPSRA